MLKKILVVTLAVCLAVVGMTVIATADAPMSISIGNTTLSSGDTISGGNGTATYQDGVLTLSNFTIAEYDELDAISSGGDLTIKFSGENSITADAGNGIYVYGSLTIIGSEGATLTVNGMGSGIKTKGGNKISISDSVITTNGITSGDSGATIVIENSTIVSTEEIYASSSITISGDVDITASEGISAYAGTITITPSTGKILEVTVGSTTSYISSAATLSSTYDTVTIKPHTHTYENGYCTACGAKDYGTIEVGYATLSDGQYTENGKLFSVQDGTPTGTTYAYYSGGVLYLSNFEYEDENMYVVSSGDLSIELSGTNTIVGYFLIFGDLSISGSGSLTVASQNGAGDYGKISAENITIEDTTLNITVSGNSAIGISSDGDFTISGSTINVTTTSTGDSSTDWAIAIYALGDIIIDDGSSITATATATGAGIAYGINAGYNITIEDDSTVIATSTATSTTAYGIIAEYGDISISGDVNITSNAGIEAYSGNVVVTPTTGKTLLVQAGTSASEITERWYLSASLTDTNGTMFTSGKYISIAPSAAHTHSYSDTWSWAEDYSSATVIFSCSGCSETWSGENVEITTETVAATCTEDGSITYTATVTFKGEEYTYEVTVDGDPATGHSYTVEWSWNGSSATAILTCSGCNDVQTIEAEVTSKNVLGVVTHTATVTFNGETYTSTQTTGTSLLTIGADYTAVYNAIAKADALNPEDYVDFSGVTEAINAVQYGLNVLNQSVVNGYAEAIEEAIANLVEVDSTVIEVDEPVEAGDTDTDEDEPEPSPETGLTLALLPITLAAAAAVVVKQEH